MNQVTPEHQHMMQLGARCDVCPLAKGFGARPVLSEFPAGARVIVVSQEPGPAEQRAGRPFAGPAGMLLDQSLKAIGHDRTDVATTNVVACMPPGGDIKAYEAKIKRMNKTREHTGQTGLALPSVCCAARLKAEVKPFKFRIPLGTPATMSLLPHLRGGIMKNRGMLFLDGDGNKVLPTLNPAMVGRKMEWLEVFLADLLRAWRFFDDQLVWRPPQVTYRPSIELLEEALFRRPWNWRGLRLSSYDWETDSIHAMTANPRCLGFGGPDWAVVVPFEPVQWRRARQLQGTDKEVAFDAGYSMDNGQTWALYDPDERRARNALLQRWATEVGITKVGWNIGTYDRIVTECRLGVTPAPMIDGILMHRSVHPALPHGLDFAGSHFTDVHNWKADHSATEAKTDEELWRYNGLDVCVNAQIWEPIYTRLEERRQTHLLPLDHSSQDAGVCMHYVGMMIDQVERARRDAVLRADIAKWTLRARALLEKSGTDVGAIVKRTAKLDRRNEEYRRELAAEWDHGGLSAQEVDEDWQLPAPADIGLDIFAFNPLSHPQLRAVLFEQWDLPVPSNMKDVELFTKAGEVSTGDSVLRRLSVDPRLTHEQRLFIHSVRMMRRVAKAWGTYVHPMRMPVGDVKADAGCKVWSDGRFHSVFNVHTPISGRYSSTGPNCQNWDGDGKGSVIAGPGRRLIGADMDQLELRIAASRWGASMYLEAFEKGLDPHQMTMVSVFGRQRFDSFAGGPSEFGRKDFDSKGQFADMRKLAKQIQYASQYAATTETVYRLVTSAEDKKTGVLLYADLSLSEVAAMHANWKKGCPEFVEGWAKEKEVVKVQGFIEEPVTGRRRDFPDGGRNDSEVVNTPIQPSAAGIMNKIMKRLMVRIPRNKWGPNTGINNQCHDSITVEAPWEVADEVVQILTEEMNVREAAFPDVEFSSEASVAPLTVWDEAKGKHVGCPEGEAGGGRSRWAHT